MLKITPIEISILDTTYISSIDNNFINSNIVKELNANAFISDIKYESDSFKELVLTHNEKATSKFPWNSDVFDIKPHLIGLSSLNDVDITFLLYNNTLEYNGTMEFTNININYDDLYYTGDYKLTKHFPSAAFLNDSIPVVVSNTYYKNNNLSGGQKLYIVDGRNKGAVLKIVIVGTYNSDKYPYNVFLTSVNNANMFDLTTDSEICYYKVKFNIRPSSLYEYETFISDINSIIKSQNSDLYIEVDDTTYMDIIIPQLNNLKLIVSYSKIIILLLIISTSIICININAKRVKQFSSLKILGIKNKTIYFILLTERLSIDTFLFVLTIILTISNNFFNLNCFIINFLLYELIMVSITCFSTYSTLKKPLIYLCGAIGKKGNYL